MDEELDLPLGRRHREGRILRMGITKPCKEQAENLSPLLQPESLAIRK